MSRLDRYLGITVANNILLVLFILIGLFSFFTFIEEVDDLGTGSYGAWQAAQYVFLHVPRRIYELFPIAALLGSLLGLGILANTNELTVIRASGFSIYRIIGAVMKIGAILLIAAIFLGEEIAPRAEQEAKRIRSVAKGEHIALQTPHGFWGREGHNFINIRAVYIGGRLGEISFYQFDENHRLKNALYAQQAHHQGEQWVLENVIETEVQPTQLKTRKVDKVVWQSPLSPDLIGILILKPDRLSTLELYNYTSYLRKNSQRSIQYELAFWQRVLYPLVTVVMVFLAVPFVFGSLRTVPVGQRILVGALLGIGFYILNQTIGYLGVLYEFNPFLSAAFPGLLFLVSSVILVKRWVV